LHRTAFRCYENTQICGLFLAPGANDAIIEDDAPMKGKAPASYQERWNDLGALRSVLTASGGEAKIEELYRILGAEEAARSLCVSESQVRHLTCRRELPCLKTGKGGVGYRLIDLINWQEARLDCAAL
jgi:hypothetical protein